MKNEIKNMITKELEQFHCSILLSEVREKVRRLKAYGVKDAKIAEALNEDELLPQLVVTKDYQILLGSENPEGRDGTSVESYLLAFSETP